MHDSHSFLLASWSRILFTTESRSPEQPERFSRETQSSSGTAHTFRWQSADDYSKDNALHVSNNWQIIYVIFSTVISVEGTNCVANIKPPAEERQKKKKKTGRATKDWWRERGRGSKRSGLGEGKKCQAQLFPDWRCTAICEETNTRMAIICPTSYVMWRLFTRHANLCGRWCMCFFSPVITSMELQSNALHLISSTGCAPRWVRDSLQDGFWHTAQPRRTSMNIIQCISPQPPTVNRSIEVDEVN